MNQNVDTVAGPTGGTQTAQEIVASTPMSRLQIVAIVMCIFLLALDGFDVLAISFAAPGIAAEFGINRVTLGFVLAIELVGMSVGSIGLGRAADRLGRRPTILICLLIMTSGMYLAALATDINSLTLSRFYTGLGIGGLLAATNAMVAEHSNAPRRNLSVILMSSGFPLGAILGGTAVSILLQYFDWRSVFLFGSIVSACFLPLAWILLPETVAFLEHKRPVNALAKINALLARMGHKGLHALNAKSEQTKKIGFSTLFSQGLRRSTVLLTVTYFAHMVTFYYIVKWIPKIVVDMGFSASSAGQVLVWANVGGLLGSISIGLLALRYQVRPLVILAFLAAALMVFVFGAGFSDLQHLSLMAAGIGFFTNSAIVGLYATFAQYFPTEVRASGTGLAIGVGRGGSALGPVLAGYLFSTGQSLQTVSVVMACGSLLAVISFAFLRPTGQGISAA